MQLEKPRFPSAIYPAWIAVLMLGTAALALYKAAPAADLAAPAAWPEGSRIQRSAERPTLLMFVHPRCACSRASVEALSQLLTRVRGRVDAHLLFYRPASMTQAWARSALWEAASAIPGLIVEQDTEGREAQLFHGTTSGHTVLYGLGGERLFDGGITPARGHVGDSFGLQALTELLIGTKGERGQSARAPIFGCAIHEPPRTAHCGGRPCTR